MGQKLIRFEELRGTRSRQDASIEVHEVGSKRPSSGGNGGHVRWCIGLICALLYYARALLQFLCIMLVVHGAISCNSATERHTRVE